MTDHTAKAFDVDLREINGMVAEMGGLVEKQVADSLDALANRDPDLGHRAIAIDASIDQLQQAIEEKAVETIARRQPMAIDLRDIVGALRIANDLERVGDLAKNIGKRVVPLSEDLHPANLMLGVERMGELVLERLRRVLDSYVNRQLDIALEVWNGDEEIEFNLHIGIPRIADLYDGGRAQHHLLPAFDVLRQKHRAHGRSRDQYCRDGILHHKRQPYHRAAP